MLCQPGYYYLRELKLSCKWHSILTTVQTIVSYDYANSYFQYSAWYSTLEHNIILTKYAFTFLALVNIINGLEDWLISISCNATLFIFSDFRFATRYSLNVSPKFISLTPRKEYYAHLIAIIRKSLVFWRFQGE